MTKAAWCGAGVRKGIGLNEAADNPVRRKDDVDLVEELLSARKGGTAGGGD